MNLQGSARMTIRTIMERLSWTPMDTISKPSVARPDSRRGRRMSAGGQAVAQVATHRVLATAYNRARREPQIGWESSGPIIEPVGDSARFAERSPIRSPKSRTRWPWSGVLVLLAATVLGPSASRGQAEGALQPELQLDYEAFDQRPGSGWRKIAAAGRYREAARLIDRYEREGEALGEWQRVNLRFHAAQLYAFAGETREALARLETAFFADEPADAPVRWNAYMRATMAFLERDGKRLAELREEIAAGPRYRGIAPNLDVVDRLIACFDEPYAVAYGDTSGSCGKVATEPGKASGGSRPTHSDPWRQERTLYAQR